MNKIVKTILIISVIIFGAGFLFVNPTQATNNKLWFGDKNISIDFNELPFDLNNWEPGMSEEKTIKIINNENFDINVYFSASRIEPFPGKGEADLADVLTITINDKSNHLSDLFDNNIILTPVNSGKSQNYDITISFDEDAGNKYQSKIINFDFIITAEEIGKGGGETLSVAIPGGGGGGVFITKLRISNESVASVKTDTVTITWQTNKSATSRVIYDTISHPTLGSPPNYGYAFSTPEQDQDPKVIFHTVRIDGLVPGTTYFYRTVSQASPEEVSGEHRFTTLTLTEGEREEGIGEEEEEEEISEEGLGPEVKGEEITGEEKEEVGEEIVAEEKRGRAGTFLAAIGQFFPGLSLKSFFFIALVLLIILLILLIFYRRRKKETLENQ